MADEFQSEDGRVILTEAGEALLLETAAADVFDFVTPFFTNSPFVSSAIFAHTGVDQKLISIIFENPYKGAQNIETSDPSCLCMDSEITDVALNDAIILAGGITYYITEIQPDGTGITTLVLSKDQVA